ncbi:DUF6879 family protein [Embleya sp. AB8]|uniref:DUF6879 family protein n=1 Tax=Embleya sp. AB8 TaxID=3156304 RepID=UPI003C74E2F2
MTTPTLDALLTSVRKRAWHLEMRDDYAGTSPAFVAWQAGVVYDRGPADRAWHALVRSAIAHGAEVRRARIVSEPISDYIRYEHEATPAANLAAGEEVRWLPRRQASDLALPGNDFWLLDDAVMFNHFTGDGTWTGNETVTDSTVVQLCAAAFEAVWQRGTDHRNYRPA